MGKKNSCRHLSDMHIVITNRENESLVKEEVFLGNQYSVVSRSGLNVTEVQVVEVLKELANPKGFFFWKTGQGFLVLLRGAYTPKRRYLSIAWTCIMPVKSGETC